MWAVIPSANHADGMFTKLSFHQIYFWKEIPCLNNWFVIPQPAVHQARMTQEGIILFQRGRSLSPSDVAYPSITRYLWFQNVTLTTLDHFSVLLLNNVMRLVGFFSQPNCINLPSPAPNSFHQMWLGHSGCKTAGGSLERPCWTGALPRCGLRSWLKWLTIWPKINIIRFSNIFGFHPITTLYAATAATTPSFFLPRRQITFRLSFAALQNALSSWRCHWRRLKLNI